MNLPFGAKNGIALPCILLGLILACLLPLPALAATTFSSATPAPGSTVGVPNPQISVIALDPVGLLLGGPQMKIDSVAVDRKKLVVTTVTGGLKVAYQPASLTNGSHTVLVSVMNRQYKTFTYTWSFTITSAPQISGVSPSDGSTVTTNMPTVYATLTDATDNPPSYEMRLNGELVTATYDPATNGVSYTPRHPLANESTVTVSLDATNTAGASAHAGWSFFVRLPQMQDSDCTGCHSGYPTPLHPVANCDACHFPSGPIGDCNACHSETHDTEPLGRYPCTTCHNSSWPQIPGHYEDPDTYHAATDTSSCTSCHATSLTREHAARNDDSGNALTCETCHESTEESVTAAITAKNTSCGACHADLSHASASSEENIADTEGDCRSCHGETVDRHHNLIVNVDDYTGLTYGCMDCHPVLFDPVSNSYYTQLERDCIVCHGSDVSATAARHHLLLQYPNPDTGVQYQCLDCHELVWDPDRQSYVFQLK